MSEQPIHILLDLSFLSRAMVAGPRGHARPSALKGRNSIAQGNALGKRPSKYFPALKGRNNLPAFVHPIRGAICAALSGLGNLSIHVNPGRCPGLWNCGLSAFPNFARCPRPLGPLTLGEMRVG